MILVGLALWGISSIRNAMNYTSVLARVERVEEMCRPAGTPIQEATACATTGLRVPNPNGKRVVRHTAVHVRYKSPADGQEHSGVVIPVGSKMASQVARLRPGDQWKILAHDDKPDDIKTE
jgi:hypothetical protein